MITRMFTFGYGHTDPRTGESLAEKFAKVTADSHERCREIMVALFGVNWAFDYDESWSDWDSTVPLPDCHAVIVVVEGLTAKLLARVEDPDRLDLEALAQVGDLLTP